MRPLSYRPRRWTRYFCLRRDISSRVLIKKKVTARPEGLAVTFISFIGLERAPVVYTDGYPCMDTCPPPLTGPRPSTGQTKIFILQRKMDGNPPATGSRATTTAREPVRAIPSSTGVGKQGSGMPPEGGFPFKTELGRGKNAIARTCKIGENSRLRALKKWYTARDPVWKGARDPAISGRETRRTESRLSGAVCAT